MKNIKNRFIDVVNSLRLDYPVRDIQLKLNRKSKGNISEYLNPENEKEPPRAFILAFCRAFNLDYTALFSEFFGEGQEQLQDSNLISGVTLGQEREVIPVGKHAPLRLTPNEYAEAYGDWKGLPMYNMPITASFVASYRDESEYHPQYFLHDPRFRDCDFGAIITGDSMYSEIRHGDFVACKEIRDISFLVYGDIYYVVAKNGLETCKYVQAGSDEEHILLVPRNEKISPSPIKKDMIRAMFKVRGIIRSY